MKINFINKFIVCILFILVNTKSILADSDEDLSNDLYVIEGKVFPWDGSPNGWQIATHVMANGGEYVGFLREDGTFTISNVPSGSYIVEIVNPNYAYDPVRVEINSKGKFRARKVNLIQTSQVIQVPYPLKMRPVSPFRYFQLREVWRVTDFLFNPMILMMILPLLLVMILPKMMSDSDTKDLDLDQILPLKDYGNMPEMSEFITSFMTSNDKQKPKAIKANKKRQ